MKKNTKITYVEPIDYFPEEIRKKYKLGEYYEESEESAEKREDKKTAAKKRNNDRTK